MWEVSVVWTTTMAPLRRDAQDVWTKARVRIAECSCAHEYTMSTSGTCKKCPKNAALSWLLVFAIIALVLVLLAMVLFFFARQIMCVFPE